VTTPIRVESNIIYNHHKSIQQHIVGVDPRGAVFGFRAAAFLSLAHNAVLGK